MNNVFWFDNPTILLKNKYITKIFPTNKDSLEEKLNAISRLIIFITLILYFIKPNYNLFLFSLFLLFLIIFIFKRKNKKNIKEGLETCILNRNYNNLTMPTKTNPLMNVLLPEIQENPKRAMAAPSFDCNMQDKINAAAIQSTQQNLFKDLGDNLNFYNSMQRFYTTANTKIPNDQKAFAEFCYTNTAQCKDTNYCSVP